MKIFMSVVAGLIKAGPTLIKVWFQINDAWRKFKDDQNKDAQKKMESAKNAEDIKSSVADLSANP